MNDNEKTRFMVMLDELISSAKNGDREKVARLRQEIIRTVTPLEKLPEFIGGTERVEEIDKAYVVTIAEQISPFEDEVIVHDAIAYLVESIVQEYLLHDKRPFQVRITHRTIEREQNPRNDVKLHQVRCEIQDTIWHDYPLRNPADIERPVKQPD